jgi:hypothetical protein
MTLICMQALQAAAQLSLGIAAASELAAAVGLI